MTFDVQKAVQTFAQEMQDLLDAVIPRPDDVPPKDRQVQVPFIEGRYAVRVAADRAKVALTKNGALIGYLRVVFQCTSDTAHNYLVVHKSIFELLGFSDRQPIDRSRRGARTLATAASWCPSYVTLRTRRSAFWRSWATRSASRRLASISRTRWLSSAGRRVMRSGSAST